MHGEGGVHGEGGPAWQMGGMHGKGGACVVKGGCGKGGGMHGKGGHAWQGGGVVCTRPSTKYGRSMRRHSYWNAFLFQYKNITVKKYVCSWINNSRKPQDSPTGY